MTVRLGIALMITILGLGAGTGRDSAAVALAAALLPEIGGESMVTKKKPIAAKEKPNPNNLSDFSRALKEQAERDRVEDEEQAKVVLDGLPDFQKNKMPGLSDSDLLELYLRHRGEAGSWWGHPKRAEAMQKVVEVEHAEILRRMGASKTPLGRKRVG